MEKQDKIIKCRNCGEEFTFTIGEQNFYEEKGFNEPVRCKSCRTARKAANEEKTEEQKKSDFEDMLKKFQDSTVSLEEK